MADRGLAFRRVGIGANLDKDLVVTHLQNLLPALTDRGAELFVDGDLEGRVQLPGRITYGIPRDCDIIVAIGGDGTLLKYARDFEDCDVPILGLKGGQLGFLTEGSLERVIECIVTGGVIVQQRMRILVEVRSNGETLKSFSALNDVVVHGAGFSRMVKLRTQVGDQLMREFRADGLIVATPTGSTAYSLSAGGPLIEPTVRAIVLTPLSPHSLGVRPLVVDSEQVVQVYVVAGRSRIVVTIDGQDGSFLEPGEHLEIRRSPTSTLLAVPNDYDFYGLLREKL